MQRPVIMALAFFLLCINYNQLQAAPQVLFKIASLAPAGSVWIEQFDNFARKVKENTGGEVTFRIYPGGVMGDDQAMYRKMKVGQLHGGGFTMTGIAAVVPDFRVLSIPFLFDSYEEVDYVIKGMEPTFKEKFSDQDLEYIAMTEVGFIYAMSTQPISTVEKLRNSKNWSPSGDPVAEAYLSTLDISPMQLTIPDVLTSLQSGLVETAYNSLYGSIVLQWFTKARYIADVPYGYAYGVFLLDGKKFNALPETHRKSIKEAAQIHFPILLQKTRESNNEARRVLDERGGEFLRIDEGTIQSLREKGTQAVHILVPESLSQESYDQVIRLRQEFRRTLKAGLKP